MHEHPVPGRHGPDQFGGHRLLPTEVVPAAGVEPVHLDHGERHRDVTAGDAPVDDLAGRAGGGGGGGIVPGSMGWPAESRLTT